MRELHSISPEVTYPKIQLRWRRAITFIYRDYVVDYRDVIFIVDTRLNLLTVNATAISNRLSVSHRYRAHDITYFSHMARNSFREENYPKELVKLG